MGTATHDKEGSSATRPRVSPLRIVGIGASAGGLEAFTALLAHLPQTGRVAYVLVQHLDPTHRSLLSELLARTTTLPVKEIAPGTRVQAGRVHVIPPNRDLEIRGGVLHLTSRQKNSGPARSIDRFLESLARDRGEHGIAVILSGAGSDGAKGLKAVKDAGGVTFAQEPGSAKYDSMPRSATATGAVDFVLPPEKIGAEIGRLLARPDGTTRRAAANARRRRGQVSTRGARGLETAARADWPAAPEDPNLRKIFLILRTRTGTDFTLYRPSTIRRRLGRRMALQKISRREDYLRFLRNHPAEVEALYQDLLINVTSFFRNPSVFESLKKRVFPRLLKSHPDGDTLRIWVPGCSTGQEAYSIAIAYAEFAERNADAVPVQIFATDVNGSVLDPARAGRYARAQLAGVSAARLEKFFVPESDGFRVAKPVRDMVIFAQQNILLDPPFTRVDLISCRNMLIYFEPALQQKIIPAFHYALKPGGVLVLGASESIGMFSNLFATLDKSGRIYAKQAATSWLRYDRPPAPPTMRLAAAPTPAARPASPPAAAADDACKEADRYALAKYVPATVVVNEDGDILQIRGDARRYLSLPAGKASLQLAKMAREGLGLALQRALERARSENRRVRERQVRLDGRKDGLDLEVVPLRGLKARCFLVVFLRAPRAPKAAAGARRAAPPGRHYAELRREHQLARAQLDNLREEHETSVEELQASNEEVQSANEELQSLNEELETSNEELESANEELTTLNEELATRNAELRESEQRMREQAELLELAPVLARSPKDRIIFWNRGAERLYGFTRDEAVGQTAHLFLGAQFREPLDKIHADLLRAGTWEGEVLHRRKDGSLVHVATQWVAHHDAQGRLRAVLEVNTDISARKTAERALRESEEFNQRILESSPDCIAVLDLAGRMVFMNAGGQRLLEADTWERLARGYWPGLWAEPDRDRAEAAYRAAVAGDSVRLSGCCLTTNGAERWWDAMVRPILGSDGRPEKILCVARDVTELRREEVERAQRARLTTLRAEIGLEVARPGELAPVLGRIADIFVRHGEAAAIHLWTVHDGVGTLQASGGESAAATARPAEDLLLQALLAGSQPRVWLHVAEDPALAEAEWVQRDRIASAAAFALRLHERVLGVLTMFTRHSLEPAVVREFELTADLVAQFIARKQVEDERQRLYQEAMTARNDAVAASRAKDDFIAALSHELRTPLNPVLLLASDGAENPDVPEKVREDFKMIRNNVSLEAKLIDDLLDLTRIVHGKLSLELSPVDAHAIVRDALAIVSPAVEQKRIDLALEFGAAASLVDGDAVRLQQVFWNVLNNAVKFTPTGGRIALRTANPAPGTIELRITDNGTGLPPSELQKIFEPFTQGGNRAGGLGLGLAISRQLVEKHGGRIAAASDGPGQGATFTISLPLLPADGATRLPAARSAMPEPPASRLLAARDRRLLLVEDHAATRSTLEALLKRRSFRVTTAASAAAALKLVETEEFDIVISDLGLPDADGYALWAALRRRLPRAVGIALSGYGMEQDLERSRAAGFAGHLTKPVSVHALDRALAALLPESVPTPEPGCSGARA